jgi:hypothetical protein
MFDILEEDIYLMPFLRGKSKTIGMDLKVPDGLLTNNVWSDHKILELLLPSFNSLKLLFSDLMDILLSNFLFIVFGSDNLYQFFDLFVSHYEVILRATLVRLESQLLDEQSIGVLALWELNGVSPGDVEVEPQDGPLSLCLGRTTLNCRYMERNKTVVNRHQNAVRILIHIYLSRFEV